MAKIRLGVLLMGFFVLLAFGLSLNLFIKGDPRSNISGLVFGNFESLPFKMNLSLIAFVGQWVLLLFIVFIGYLRFLKHRREEEVKVNSFTIPQYLPKPQTNFDVFYNLLKENKTLSLNVIARLFKISKEKALEWARILEEKDLAVIEYPAFSDPEVRIKGYKESMEKEKQAKSENISEVTEEYGSNE